MADDMNRKVSPETLRSMAGTHRRGLPVRADLIEAAADRIEALEAELASVGRGGRPEFDTEWLDSVTAVLVSVGVFNDPELKNAKVLATRGFVDLAEIEWTDPADPERSSGLRRFLEAMASGGYSEIGRSPARPWQCEAPEWLARCTADRPHGGDMSCGHAAGARVDEMLPPERVQELIDKLQPKHRGRAARAARIKAAADSYEEE